MDGGDPKGFRPGGILTLQAHFRRAGIAAAFQCTMGYHRVKEALFDKIVLTLYSIGSSLLQQFAREGPRGVEGPHRGVASCEDLEDFGFGPGLRASGRSWDLVMHRHSRGRGPQRSVGAHR
ncbi:MAG: hypothetical protein D6812_04305 [Deltaproteobacteria bacterium]|nr:MAG: hypothetical protein D6812_04305 [Deltaproteobacteria bacterium]